MMHHACKRVSQLTSDSFERKLSLAERVQLRLHFSICRLCRNYYKNLLSMEEIFLHLRRDNLNQNIHLPDKAKQHIQAVLKKESQSN